MDQGPGISPEDLAMIFDTFYQVERGDTRIPGGWGLGLAIAKALVLEHRGAIWAESVVGEGSTFVFELPKVFGGTPE
jgi:signal transduction histidine kinase